MSAREQKRVMVLNRLVASQWTQQAAASWEQARNTAGATVDWRVTTEDARIKLKRLYPSIQG